MELKQEEIRAVMQACWDAAVTLNRFARDGELLPQGEERLHTLQNVILQLEPASGITMTKLDRIAIGLPAGDAPDGIL